MQAYSQTPTDAVRAADGIDFAFRRVGNRGGIPLVLANYFAANMDDWDPLIVDGLAADRDVIAFDYPGIGSSTGATPATVAEFAVNCIGFLHALGLGTIDFLGFSLGGMFHHFRPLYQGTLIANVGMTQDRGNNMVSQGLADLVAFGQPFIANPDLPARFAARAPIAKSDNALNYVGGAHGYTDYSPLQADMVPNSSARCNTKPWSPKSMSRGSPKWHPGKPLWSWPR